VGNYTETVWVDLHSFAVPQLMSYCSVSWPGKTSFLNLYHRANALQVDTGPSSTQVRCGKDN